ncbi:MAG: DNA glycosylase AlkZ-like family protein [Actinocrinis sp.]
MAGVHELSRAEARRIAVRAQLLDARRPAGLLEAVRHLTLLRVDPTSAVAPSADLVAWSRLGARYVPGELESALADRSLVHLRGMIRPAEDVALYRADMAAWPGVGQLRGWQVARGRWVEANEGCRREILRWLASDGALPARALPDTCAVPWESSGWNDERNVVQLLEFMVQRGEVAVAGRDARGRLYDLAERVYPDEPAVPLEQARRVRDERRLRSLGIARGRATEQMVEPLHVGEAGEAARVEGVKGLWRVDRRQLEVERDGGEGGFAGRAALLSPFDLLVVDRKRTDELFEYDYQLEMYKPAGRRRWGYYALPILCGERLIGKLDARADRAAGVLRVAAVYQDEPFGRQAAAQVRAQIEELAHWLGLGLALPG